MRAILIIMDGLGDLRVNGSSPLEKANKPNIDGLAKEGAVGLFVPYKIGVPVGSDVGHLHLLGYGMEDYVGRGVFEALGLGIELSKGDVAFRANIATLENGKIVDRRAGRIPTQYHLELAKEIDGIEVSGVKIRYFPSTSHRAVVVLRGEGLSEKVSPTDPKQLGAPPAISKPLAEEKEAVRTANVVNEVSKIFFERLSKAKLNERLEKKANYVLLRGAGKYREVSLPFEKKYGIKPLFIAGKEMYKGIARYLGFDVLDVPKEEDEENLIKKAKLALNSSHELVVFHVKEADEAGHDGDFEKKVRAIEKVDKIIPLLKEGFDIIFLTGDHSTPVSYKAHSGHPVPLLMWGKNIRKDSIEVFSEYNHSIVLRKQEVMLSLLNALGKGKMKGY